MMITALKAEEKYTLILIILITMICYDQLKDPDEGVSNWDNRWQSLRSQARLQSLYHRQGICSIYFYVTLLSALTLLTLPSLLFHCMHSGTCAYIYITTCLECWIAHFSRPWSIGWVALSFYFVRSLSVPLWWHPTKSPLLLPLDPQTYTFSESLW